MGADGPGARVPAPGGSSFTGIVRSALGGRGGAWEIRSGGFWTTALPPRHVPREQGWKLHVSASSAVGADLLSRVVAVAAEQWCAFKCASGPEALRSVNSRNCERGSAGKFITLYPTDDDRLAAVADAVHRATAGLPGPVVLSDRPYRPGSRVHYRYGGFTGRAGLSPDGIYRTMLTAPDGSRVEDVRGPRFAPPPWATDPLAGPSAPAADSRRAEPTVTLAGRGRYTLVSAIRRAAKGGVFLGTDPSTGEEVVVKQACAHIEVDSSGRDACAALRHEAGMLARLAPYGPVPRPLELVERDGQVFLVLEKVPGLTLADWVAARLADGSAPDGPGVPWPLAGPLAHALTRCVWTVHEAGVVLGDLTPGNVMVRPDGTPRVIDLELAACPGDRVGRAGTPGYAAPGRAAAVGGEVLPAGGAIADPRDDLFALGGLLFLLATGHDPPPPDEEGGVPRGWLALAALSGETARRLAPLVTGLRRTDPARRTTLRRAMTLLDGGDAPRRAPARGGGLPSPGAAPVPAPADDALLDRLLADGVAHLAATARPGRADRLWPTTPNGLRTDPCNVQHGAGGVLAVLARVAATTAAPEAVRSTARTTALMAADWIVRRLAEDRDEQPLPGLHFGRSGTAWALLDAAGMPADPAGEARGAVAPDADALARCAQGLGDRIPVRWPNPDVCHGVAGGGFLHLRTRNTEAADACAQRLLATARPSPSGPLWPVPKGFDSAFAGTAHLGYAHGAAGVGAFLLAAAGATGDRAYRDAAVRAGGTLAATARRDAARPGGAWWPRSADDPPHVRRVHWCSGSSGVGTFLVRLWQATGDESARDLAVAAGEAVLRARWHGTTAACHGLAGDGEFLLDLARATGSARFLAGARAFAALLAARAATRNGLLVTWDETGRGHGAGHGDGTSGALAFVLRLRHGGPRLWADPVPYGDRPAAGTRPAACSDRRSGTEGTTHDRRHAWRNTSSAPDSSSTPWRTCPTPGLKPPRTWPSSGTSA
ncbi:class IV lanthionine synthetase LanL [Streptomyces olivoreticuli]